MAKKGPAILDADRNPSIDGAMRSKGGNGARAWSLLDEARTFFDENPVV
jgi:hypothetical protein